MLSYNDLGKKKKKKRLEYQDRYSSEICLIFHVNPISGVWISVRLSHPSGISILSRETGRKNLGGNLRSHETGGGLILFGRYDAEVATLETHSSHTWSLEKKTS